MSGGVGRTPDGRALHGDGRIGKVLAALRIDDMPRNIRIALFSGFHDGFSCGETLYPYWDSAACTVMRK